MMNRCVLFPRGLAADQHGASAVEFALIAIPFFALLFGAIDIGYQVYVRTVVAGSLERAARSTTVENANSEDIENILRATVTGVMPNAEVDIKSGSFYNYSQIDAMERLTKDSNGNGNLDKGDCWEDVDGNGMRNMVSEGRGGIGGADDVVRYNVTASYPRLLPIYGLFGIDPVARASASILVKRQPYAGQSSPSEHCLS